jgi:hypothetical protein
MSATNRVHHLYFKKEVTRDQTKKFALAFLNPLTLATVEVASRVYGGGVLKIEPGDCSHIMVPDIHNKRIQAIGTNILEDLNALLRMGEDREAIDQAAAAVSKALSVTHESMNFAKNLYWELRTRRTKTAHQRTKTKEEAGIASPG